MNSFLLQWKASFLRFSLVLGLCLIGLSCEIDQTTNPTQFGIDNAQKVVGSYRMSSFSTLGVAEIFPQNGVSANVAVAYKSVNKVKISVGIINSNNGTRTYYYAQGDVEVFESNEIDDFTMYQDNVLVGRIAKKKIEINCTDTNGNTLRAIAERN